MLNSQYYCRRCGNYEQRLFYRYFCEKCQQHCWYCRSCVNFGIVTTCTHIVVDTQEFSLDSVVYAWNGQLSCAQAEASRMIREWICQQKTGMVYAVCGAGKTEMMFEGIYAALEAGKRICWATPRTDVVKELQPRLQQAFPQTKLASHYQNSPDGQLDAQLVLATTHQLVRYYQAFDCIIIDEVDAFPYTVDTKLARFAERALNEQGHFIYLTATPSQQLRRKFQENQYEIWQLPGRYHRRALPVPKYCLWGTSRKIITTRFLRKKLFRHLQTLIENDRVVMIFVPTIHCCEVFIGALSTEFGSQCDFVHSQDPDRQEKVQKLRERTLKILVTTTILERGVTINWCEVVVLDADHEVFDWSALVQISGRVDRKNSDQYASILFIGEAKTRAMMVAIKEIQACNKLAKKRGLIE